MVKLNTRCATAAEVASCARDLSDEITSVLEAHGQVLSRQYGSCQNCASRILATALLESYLHAMETYLTAHLPLADMADHWAKGMTFQHYAAMSMVQQYGEDVD